LRSFLVFLSALSLIACGRSADTVRAELARGVSVVELPAGETHLDKPIVIPKGAKNIRLRGASGSRLIMDAGFKGSAAIVADGVSNIALSGFAITGNRVELKSDWYLPLNEAAFADYYTDNGIVIRNSSNVTIEGVTISNIRAFPVIINATAKSLLDSVFIESSGTLNRDGHNNTTGGILIEEGSSGFEVRNSTVHRVSGNAIWTHSYARSPRQSDGLIRNNEIFGVARDAIQIGHATHVRVEKNKGDQIGFPVAEVDFAGQGTPVALDTAGNVDHSVYQENEFTNVAGQCIDLDGFHDGEVTDNKCVNKRTKVEDPGTWIGLHFGILFGNHDPGMTSSNVLLKNNTVQGFAYGGLFLIGDHNTIVNNQFVNVDLADCGIPPVSAKCNAMLDQPDALRSGIYLSNDGGRPAVTRENTIRDNLIVGLTDKKLCVTAKPGVDLKANSVADNICYGR
jgi:hypothetical protein